MTGTPASEGGSRRRRRRRRGGSGRDAGAAGGSAVTRPEAVRLARRAVDDLGEGPAGRHLGVALPEGPGAAVHRFAARLPGYRGWEWHVVLAAAPGADRATVSEVALVPGEAALRAPEWVPYEERLEPGDLGPRDLLPPAADDPRLTPGEAAQRRLTEAGLAAAARRWTESDTGPGSEFAAEAIRSCASCAFLIPLAGELGGEFGVCANEWAFDGAVVHRGHGCGAHSATPEVTGQGAPVGDADVV